jgi:ATP-dependent RNA helicase DeaD
VIDALADEFDLMEIALAAVRMAHEATGTDADDEDIPDITLDRGRDDRRPRARESGRGRTPSSGMTRLFVGAGRNAGIRPQDLVGAIAGETRLSGRDIGAIEIADRFSLVEVPDDAVDEVVRAMRATTIKGKKANVRRERF